MLGIVLANRGAEAVLASDVLWDGEPNWERLCVCVSELPKSVSLSVTPCVLMGVGLSSRSEAPVVFAFDSPNLSAWGTSLRL